MGTFLQEYDFDSVHMTSMIKIEMFQWVKLEPKFQQGRYQWGLLT